MAEENKIEIPEGKEVTGARFFCSKHGEITNAASTIDTVSTDENGNQKTMVTVICLQCLTDFYQKMQESGEFGSITISPVFSDIKEKEEEKE